MLFRSIFACAMFVATPVTAETVLITGADLLAKKAELDGKLVTTECILTLADDSLGSMCGFRDTEGSVMLDARSWPPETKALVMGECNPSTASQICELTVTGIVNAKGVVLKLESAMVTIKGQL